MTEYPTGQTKAGLLRHDTMIVANELRSALSTWSDRLLAIASLGLALIAIRAALSHRPVIVAALAVGTLAAAVGAGAARMIERRLDYHSEDGALAAQVWIEQAKRNYAVSIHAAVCVFLSICAGIGRPAAAVVAPVAYVIGAGICHGARRMVSTGVTARRTFSVRHVKRMLQRPIAGALTSIVVALPMLLLKSLEPAPIAVVVGLVSAVATILLTLLDYHVVRFMTESGYSVARIIGIHARSLSTFFIVAVLASLAVSDGLVSIVLCGVVLVAMLFMTIRIMAYRRHSKRSADMLVSVYAGIAALTAGAMPMVLPIVVLAMLWQLYHRARPATWLLT